MSAVTDQLTWEMLLVNQALIQKTKVLVKKPRAGSTVVRHIICTNCAASAWFLNQDLGIFEWVLGLQVSGKTGESAEPLTSIITDQLMTQ